jgi:hypothetical protein
MGGISIMYRFHSGVVISAIVFVLMGGELLAAEENVPALRYGFQAGKKYAYEVKIKAELEKYDETREGVLTFTVSSADDSQFVLKPSGNLPARIKPHPNEIVIPRGFPFPTFIRPGGPEGISFNRRGEKIVSRELTQLPYLLGDMELLAIEEFPLEAKSSWEKQLELHVVERDFDGPFPRLMFAARLDGGTHTTAKEHINYDIVKREKDKVEISKKYSLRSIPEGDKPSRFEMTGEGQFTFDLSEGLITSLSMKYECRVNEKNVIRKVPIALTCRLLSAEELAQWQKKAEEARAAAAKAAEPKALDSRERARLLRDLRSADANRLRAAADRLAKAQVDNQPAEIAQALAALLDNSNEWVQRSAAKALVVWATPKVEDALIKASQAEDVFLRNPSIEALGKLKTAKAAQAVAAQMYQQSSRHDVSETLKAMGAVAEDATIALLSDRDMWVRGEACAVLGVIGGKKALEALRDFTQKKSAGYEQMQANKAIDEIEQRLESKP